MSVKSFIPAVMANELLLGFEEQAIIAQVTFPVETTARGSYIINKFGDITVANYTGEVEYAELGTTSVEVKFDTAKYFAFTVADIDKAQIAGDIKNPALQNASHKMAKVVDEDMVARILASGANAEAMALTKENVYEALVDVNTRLSEKDVPMSERVVLCGHDVIGMLLKDADFKANAHHDVMTNGMEVYRVNGVQIIPTNRVGKGHMIGMHKSAVAYGLQIDEVEALRLESQFADGVRGLQNYGITVVREEAIEIVKPSA